MSRLPPDVHGGGLLLMSGLGTRLISVPFLIEMLVAILSTKISLYLGTSPLPAPPALPVMGGGPCCTRFAPSTPKS